MYFAECLSIRSDLSSHGQRKEGEEDHRNKQSFLSYHIKDISYQRDLSVLILVLITWKM